MNIVSPSLRIRPSPNGSRNSVKLQHNKALTYNTITHLLQYWCLGKQPSLLSRPLPCSPAADAVFPRRPPLPLACVVCVDAARAACVAMPRVAMLACDACTGSCANTMQRGSWAMLRPADDGVAQERLACVCDVCPTREERIGNTGGSSQAESYSSGTRFPPQARGRPRIS